MVMQESGEMYLETILKLQQQKGAVRSIDISTEMGYSKPSVSRAVKLLSDDGYITVEKGGHIMLTQSGKAIAEKIFERHNLISEYLIALGVSENVAMEDACKIEHVISDETFAAIKKSLSSVS